MRVREMRVRDVRPGDIVRIKTPDTIYPAFKVRDVIRHLRGGATVYGHADDEPYFVAVGLDDPVSVVRSDAVYRPRLPSPREREMARLIREEFNRRWSDWEALSDSAPGLGGTEEREGEIYALIDTSRVINGNTYHEPRWVALKTIEVEF